MQRRILPLSFLILGLSMLVIAHVAVAQTDPPPTASPGLPPQPPVQEVLVPAVTQAIAPAEKFGQYAVLWRERLMAVTQHKEKKATEILGGIRQQATQDGVRNLDLMAFALVREALRFVETAPELVSGRFEAAKQMAPDLASVHLAEGWVLFRQGPGSYPNAFRAYLAAYHASKRDFWTSLNWVGDVMVIFLGTALSVLLVYALVMEIRYLPKLHHHLAEMIGDKVPPLVLQSGLGLLLLAPFLFSIGIGWAGIMWLALVWLYMNGRERVVALTLIVMAGIGGLAMPYVAGVFRPGNSPMLEAMVHEYRGEPIPGFAASLEPTGPEAWRGYFIRGLFFQRTGYADEAQRQYEQALALNPGAFPVWIDLGGLQYKRSQYAESIRTYLHTLQLNPQSFEAHFNLAQAYRENLQFNESAASLEEAKRINLRLADKYTQRGLNDPGSQIILIEIEPVDLWREAMAMSAAKEADGKGLLRTSLGIGPGAAWASSPQSIAVMTVILGIALGLIGFVRVGDRMPFACHLCGRMICPKCQLLFSEKRVCTDCWEKSRRGHVHEKDTARVSSGSSKAPLVLGVIPGALDFYKGSTGAGLVAMSVFFAAIWGLVVGYALMGPPVAIPMKAAAFVPGLLLAACMILGAYIWTLKRAFTHRSKK